VSKWRIRSCGGFFLACSFPLIAGLLTASAPSMAQDQPVLEQLQDAIELLRQGRPEEGLARLQVVIAEEPRLAPAYYYAGMASGQLRRWQQAYDYFDAATEQAPGYGDAHKQACRVAYNLGNLDDSFRHAVLAAQAGIDMSAAFAGLQAAMEMPPDWPERIQVTRVLVGRMDTEALLQQDSSVFGGRQAESSPPSADQSGVPPVDPLAGLAPPPSSGAFPLPLGITGSRLAAELQAEFWEVRRRFGEELVRSQMFGVVTDLAIADLVLFLKVDDVGEGPQFPLKGFVKLLDPGSGDEVYSRPLELSDIGSINDVRSDVQRYVGYLEKWLREQQR
jgi:tetratricopeptide (TPR) repeat protein